MRQIVGKSVLVLFDSLHLSQQIFSHVGTGLPGLTNTKQLIVSCSRTQHSDSAGGETRTSNPSIPSLMLYQLSHCILLFLLYAKSMDRDQPVHPCSLTRVTVKIVV